MIDDLSPAARELLDSPAVATVATINADGSVHLSAAWVGVEEDEIVFTTVFEGVARITPGGAAEMLQRLARTYLGPEVIFPAMPSPPPGYITHVRVERVRGIGPWLRGDT